MKPTRRWVLVDHRGEVGAMLFTSRETASREKYERECCGQVREGEGYQIVEVEVREAAR